MASVNKVILVGNLGRDPEMRYLPSGEAVANLAIATSEKYKDKSGEMQEHTEWHRVSFFGKIAEVCGQYLTKGSQIYVEGGLRTRKYTDKDGVEKYSTEIRGEKVQFLGGNKTADSGQRDSRPSQPQQEQRRPMAAAGGGNGFDDMEDDIPF